VLRELGVHVDLLGMGEIDATARPARAHRQNCRTGLPY